MSISFLAASIFPHSLFELPTFFYAVSLGLVICLQRSRRHRQPENYFSIGEVNKPRAVEFPLSRIKKIFAFIITPLLLVAAIIEAFLTPLIMDLFTH